MRFAPVLVLAALGLACASGPANTLAPGHAGAPGVAKLLVCAPNTVLGLAAELQRGTAPLRAEIDAYLRAQGREVEWVDLYDAKQLWMRALGRAKQAGDISRTPAFFAEELARGHEFDAIVMPSILLHQTRASSSSARWDGVKRRMRMLNAPSLGHGRSQNTLAEGIAYGGISGPVAVTSLHVMVFSGGGERVFEGRGGLELVHDIDMSALDTKRSWSYQLRDDLFVDRSAIREGVAIALDPYLPALAEP